MTLPSDQGALGAGEESGPARSSDGAGREFTDDRPRLWPGAAPTARRPHDYDAALSVRKALGTSTAVPVRQ